MQATEQSPRQDSLVLLSRDHPKRSIAMDATEGYSKAWLAQSTTNGQKLLILPECLGMVDVQDAEADSF